MIRGRDVLHAWRSWTGTVSEQTMSCGRLLQFPPLPDLPDPLRGQALVAVEVAHQGDPGELADALAPLRALDPFLDTIAQISAPQLADLHMDPPGPTPATGNGLLLADLPPSAIDALIACAGHGSASPLLSVELRHLGGAAARRPPHAGAVGHFDAPYLMFAVGVTPDAATTHTVAARVAAIEQAMSPWAADIHYANFVERPCERHRFHDPHTLRRLQQIKDRIDPDCLFRSSHPLPMTRVG
jgi:FAD/FMN-containing dehydrogenase